MSSFRESLRHMFCYEPKAPTKKNELRSRWAIMMLQCVALFGSYYIFDIPAATENAMQSVVIPNVQPVCNGDILVNATSSSSAANTFNSDFNLLYSVYSWPNIILPFFGGYISDKLGVRLMGVVFMTLITVGQAVVALGSSYLATDTTAAWYTMWAGRTIFGFGGESLSVVQSAFVAQYFQGKELAFAMGVNLALARVGSVVNNEVSGAIANNVSVALAYWVGLVVCGFALISMTFAFYMDVRAENILRKSTGLAPLQDVGLFASLARALRCRRNYAPVVDNSDSESLLGAHVQKVPEAPKEEIHFGAVLQFPLIFWVLTLSCLTIYIDVLTFNNNCADFVTQKYLAREYDLPIWQMCPSSTSGFYLTANSIMSITYLVAGFTTPLFGSVCDWFGMRAVFNVFAASAITAVHAVLGNTFFYPAVPLVGLGLCYSIYASALWPSIAIVIAPAYQATAYGVVTAVQNFGLAVSPIVVGKLMPDPHCPTYDVCVDGWTRTEWFFIYLGCAGIACGIALNIVDSCWSKYPALNLSDAALKKRMRANGDLPEESPPQLQDGPKDGEEHIFPFSIAPPSPAPGAKHLS